MPPTVQSGGRDNRDRRDRRDTERKSELVCRVKYNNSLPDIPFDPKFIIYPFESNRFVQYNPTSLERTYKHELLTEHDLGVTIDLINPETYKEEIGYLEPEDERLLEEDIATPQDSKRSRHHNKNVSWLRKTEYISTEYNRFTPLANKAEARVGFNIKKYFKDEDIYKDRESQLQAIEETFQAAKAPITKHYSKPGVTPLDVLALYPDFEMWKHPCAQVIFDSDPAPKGRTQPAQIEEMSQAMIRGMVDEQGDQFVAYFLPTEETLRKRKSDMELEQDYEEDGEYDYVLSREYNWNVKNKASKGYEETYFFVMKQDGVFYNELETRVRLSKRRKIGERTGAPTSNSRLIVKHRQLNDMEVSAQDARMTMLEQPGEEEEEEEEEFNFGDFGDQKAGEGGNAGSGDEEKKSDAEDSDKEDNDKEDNDKKSVSSGSGSEQGSPPGSPRSGSGSPKSGSGSPRSGSGSPHSRSGSPASKHSGSASPASRHSGSGSGSESSDESDHGEDKQRKDTEEIFGSESSDED